MTMRELIREDHKQFQGDPRVFWGKLTDDDSMQIAGDKQRLINKLRERYGWSQQQAEREVTIHFGK
jgi:uncharacterized protein YjbJ (UPF0337 family)